MDRTNRNLNPLDPHYHLPTYLPGPPHEPVFQRDTLYIGDIERSSPMSSSNKFQTRNSMLIQDIPGAQSLWKATVREKKLSGVRNILTNSLSAADFNQNVPLFSDLTSRCIDVMQPVYQFNGMEIKDDPTHTKPKHPKRFIADNLLLRTDDIPGATPGSLEKLKKPRSEYRNLMNTLDLPGAQVRREEEAAFCFFVFFVFFLFPGSSTF